jgi:hypothetical protein
MTLEQFEEKLSACAHEFEWRVVWNRFPGQPVLRGRRVATGVQHCPVSAVVVTAIGSRGMREDELRLVPWQVGQWLGLSEPDITRIVHGADGAPGPEAVAVGRSLRRAVGR